MTKQDREIKGNPWLVTPIPSPGRDGELWLVPSASGGGDYTVDLAALAAGVDWRAVCTCVCQRRCWHVDAALLRQRLDAIKANCDQHYTGWSLDSLTVEDRRLRALFAHPDLEPRSAGAHFLTVQYAAVGDAILAHTAVPEAA